MQIELFNNYAMCKQLCKQVASGKKQVIYQLVGLGSISLRPVEMSNAKASRLWLWSAKVFLLFGSRYNRIQPDTA